MTLSECHRTLHIPHQQPENRRLRSSQQRHYSDARVAGLSTDGRQPCQLFYDTLILHETQTADEPGLVRRLASLIAASSSFQRGEIYHVEAAISTHTLYRCREHPYFAQTTPVALAVFLAGKDVHFIDLDRANEIESGRVQRFMRALDALVDGLVGDVDFLVKLV